MKVSEVFERALALLNEDESRAKSFKKNVLPLVNQLLAQCFGTENAIRESKDAPILERADVANSLDYEIIYNEDFVSNCLPYGLAALLCADDDRSMSNAMGEQFERLKKSYHVANYANIKNHY